MDNSTRRLFIGFWFVVGAMIVLDLTYFTDASGTPQNELLWFPAFFAVIIVAWLLFSGTSITSRIAGIRSFLLNTLLRRGTPTRSDWEISIEQGMREEYPGLRIITNDRSTIPKRKGLGYLEIDIWVPDIRLAIEANGESYHDHAGYLDDLHHSTVNTNERYKELYCQRHGITFLHVWSSESKKEIKHNIDSEVRQACFITNHDYDAICRKPDTYSTY